MQNYIGEYRQNQIEKSEEWAGKLIVYSYAVFSIFVLAYQIIN